jgi:hypothetical protein
MKFLPVSDNIQNLTTYSVNVPLPNNDELRQLVWGVFSELSNIENYDPDLSFEYRFLLASFFTQMFLDWTDAAF